MTLTAAGSEAGQLEHVAGRRYVTKVVNGNNPALRGIFGSSRENVDIGGIADRAAIGLEHAGDIEAILDIRLRLVCRRRGVPRNNRFAAATATAGQVRRI